jgi:pullulanase/glycogen debranching enzyme
MNCLRYWVADMHVDGLRFDLASVLGRGHDGRVLPNPPVLEMIAMDGVLAGTKLIAEPWDAAGLYQVGAFPYGDRWTEWNGMYRDCVRRFWKGDAGLAGQLATRMCGSADLYEKEGRKPYHSINFITCHDGFTRKRHPALRRRDFLKDGDIIWHGTKPHQPDFSSSGRTLAFALDGRRTGREPDDDLYVAMNAWREAVTFILPSSPQGRPWRRLVDTSLPSPQDIVEADEGVELKFGTFYTLAGNALLVLAAGRG